MLNQRLAELRETALVEVRADAGYALTAAVCELLAHLLPLTAFAERCAKARG